MPKWATRASGIEGSDDKVLEILYNSPIEELLGVQNLAHRMATGGFTLNNTTDRIYDELNGYLKLCQDRSAEHPNAELGFLQSLSRYKNAEADIRGRIQGNIKDLLLSEAGMDKESVETLPLPVRERLFSEFSHKYLGINHQYGNVADPMIKAEGKPMTWDEMMENHIDKLAGTVTNRLMKSVLRAVHKEHGYQSAV